MTSEEFLAQCETQLDVERVRAITAARGGDQEGAPLERLRAYCAAPAPLMTAAAQFTLAPTDRDS
jgi:hypothetical protein